MAYYVLFCISLLAVVDHTYFSFCHISSFKNVFGGLIMLTLLTGFFRNICALVGMVGLKNSFPPALSKDEEESLLLRLQSGDAEARNKLIEHNLRLVAHIAKKYVGRGRDNDDLISIGTVGLIKAIGTFKPERGHAVAAYAARCIENAIIS